MRPARGKVAARVVLAAIGLLTGVTFALPPPGATTFDLLWTLPLLAFGIVGTLVVSRDQRNVLAWVFLAIPLAGVLHSAAIGFTHFALVARGDELALGHVTAWIVAWTWIFQLALPFTFALLLFPDGRPPSRRWRPVVWASGAAVALIAGVSAIHPRALEESNLAGARNPLGITGVTPLLEKILAAGGFLLVASAFACVASVVWRFVKARGEQRLQLKWFAYAGGINLVAFLITTSFVDLSSRVDDVVFMVGVTLFPIAAGIAILRYRLYDIDILINRTLVYGALTGLLALGYLGGVALLQYLLPLEDEIAVAASTLAIAALFRPLRRRIQDFIDHRFYRRKYDAARTVERFSARLRDEVDLDDLSTHLLEVVETTMQPSRISLWLKEPPTASRGAARGAEA